MITVKFQSEHEFLEEIVKDADLIERGIVRLTYLQKPTPASPFRQLYLIGTFSVGLQLPPCSQIVRLDRYYGELTGDPTYDKPVYEAAAAGHGAISSVCKENDLEIRPGIAVSTVEGV